MSQRQQIINKYIYDIRPSISSKYQLHFLAHETDSPAKQMILTSLKQISATTNQKDIIRVIEELDKNPDASIVYGIKNPEDSEKKSKEGTGFEKNFSPIACSALSSLRFHRAIKYFDKERKKANSDSKFYMERAECYFMLEKYSKAYSLAKKSNDNLLQFLMALVTGRFSEAASFCHTIVSIITDRSDSSRSHDKFVNNFDLYQLLMYSLLASQPSTKVVEVNDLLTSTTMSYSFETIQQIINAFKCHQFAAALQSIDALEKELSRSIYSYPVEKQLKDAIVQNLIVNFVRPFGTIRIDDIAKETKIDNQKVTTALIRAIRSGDLTGRIDPDERVFLRSESRYAQVQAAYDKLQIIRQRIELAQWNNEIAKQIKFNNYL